MGVCMCVCEKLQCNCLPWGRSARRPLRTMSPRNNANQVKSQWQRTDHKNPGGLGRVRGPKREKPETKMRAKTRTRTKTLLDSIDFPAPSSDVGYYRFKSDKKKKQKKKQNALHEQAYAFGKLVFFRFGFFFTLRFFIINCCIIFFGGAFVMWFSLCAN